MQMLTIKPFLEPNHLHLIPELTELLHEAYRPLLEKGLRYLATHQPPETTLQRLRKGHAFLAFDGEQLIGTITLVCSSGTEDCEWYRRPDLFYFTQFAVRPEYQGRGLGKKLMDFVEEFAERQGAREIALDTSEHAHELINMYRGRKYEHVAHVKWSMTNYRSVILSKELRPS